MSCTTPRKKCRACVKATNKNATRFHDKSVVKANRLGRYFDASDLLNIFISGIDDSITPAVQQRYNDQSATFRKTNVTPKNLQLNEVLRNIATYADKLLRDNQGKRKKRRRNENVKSATTPTGSTSSSMPTVDATR